MDSKLVFVCGFPSSGTDLLKNLLNAHPQIHIGGEFPLLASLARRYGDRLTPVEAQLAIKDIVTGDVYGNLARHELELEPNGAITFASLYSRLLSLEPVRWVGNKTPQNAEHVDELNHLFPKAKFILIVRDLRDVALSWKNKWGKDLYLCAHRWNERMGRVLRSFSSLDSDRFLIMTYETLLLNHEEIARRLCTFLGLDYDERMKESHLYVTAKAAGKIHYGEPIIQNNTQKWRKAMSPAMIKRLEEIGFESLQRFGYRCEYASAAKPLSALGRIRGRLVDLLAIIFVGNRAFSGHTFSYRLRALRVELTKRFGRFRAAR